MRKLFCSLLLFASLLLLSNCTRTSDFTVLSTKNVLLGLDKSQYKGNYQGEDTKSIIVFIPTGVPNMKEAADKALERGKGNLLIDAVIYQKVWYIPLIYGQVSYIVKGDVYRIEQPNTKTVTAQPGLLEKGN